MTSMSYCRHENTAKELENVWEQWYDYKPGSNEYEDRGRRRIIASVREIYETLGLDDEEE